MRILIEGYQYDYEDVYDVLRGLGVLQDVEGKGDIRSLFWLLSLSPPFY